MARSPSAAIPPGRAGGVGLVSPGGGRGSRRGCWVRPVEVVDAAIEGGLGSSRRTVDRGTGGRLGSFGQNDPATSGGAGWVGLGKAAWRSRAGPVGFVWGNHLASAWRGRPTGRDEAPGGGTRGSRPGEIDGGRSGGPRRARRDPADSLALIRSGRGPAPGWVRSGKAAWRGHWPAGGAWGPIRIGWVKAPLVATSQASNRAQVRPARSGRRARVWRPKGGVADRSIRSR